MRARYSLLIPIMAAALTVSNACPVYASMADCHDLVMSYIIADQDPPQEPGDYLYHEDGTAHRLTETTGYCQGTHGSHGDKMRTGYVAYTPESYGYCMEIYKAVETDEGYKLGDFIGLYEIRDCGYGKPTGEGRSAVRKDKNKNTSAGSMPYQGRGTIESGLSVDRYAPTLSECKKWMEETGGMIFIRLIPAKG